MGDLVTIVPKPGSRKFRVYGSGMTQFNQVAGDSDPNNVASTGEFKGQRFPNSRQPQRVFWSFTKRRWMLAGATKNSAKLNQLVAACKLKYEKGDPRYPNYIKEADIFDPDDAFFKHNKLKVLAKEGEFALDKSVPKDQILIMGMQARHEFALVGDDFGGPTSTRVKFLITDKNIDQQIKEGKRNREIEAAQLFASLDKKKKVQIAMGMGLIARETEDEVLVDEVLWDAAKNVTSRAGNGLTVQEYFIAMCNTTTDELNVRYLIQKSRSEGHLKLTKDQGWLLFGQTVGLNDAQVYQYFKNPENQEILIRLQQVLDSDTAPAPSKVQTKVEDQPLFNLEEQPARQPLKAEDEEE